MLWAICIPTATCVGLLSVISQAISADTTVFCTTADMASNRLMMLSVLGWVPCALALPNLHLARATTAAPVVSFAPSMVHTPYTGTPTVTGALNASSTLAANISSLGVAPSATTYPSDGRLQDPVPAPFVPAGGVGTNGTTPVYNAKSDFDFQSLVCPLIFSIIFELQLYGIIDLERLGTRPLCRIH